MSSSANDCLKIKGKSKPRLVTVPKKADGSCPRRTLSIAQIALQGTPGEKGEPGSDAQFNGATAGGDLTGTFPNPALASGVVTTDSFAALPSVRVRRSNGTALIVPNATSLGSAPYAEITFNQVLHDTANFYNADDGKIYAPRAGVYLISGHVSWPDNETGFRILRYGEETTVNQRAFNILKGNFENGAFLNFQSFSSVLTLDEGVQIKLEANQNSGGDLALANSGAGLAEFSVVWLHP